MPQGIQLFNFKYKSMEKNSHESFSDGIFRLKKVKGKVSWLMLFLGVCLLPGNVFAQEQKVTLDFVDAKVSDVFDEINRQTGLGFVYNRTQLQEINPVTLQVKNVTVDAAMSRLLEGTSFEHYFEMGSIVVRRREQPAQQVEERKVAGVVKDEAGNPLPGVSILLKGTTLGTATDVDGKYTLTLPEGNHTLVFSMLGMKVQEELIGKRTEINVTMQEDVTEMDEVVVTGIFTRKAESFTGSAQTYDSKELRRVGNTNILQSLKNLDPSFQIMENLVDGSNPNVMPEIQLRGQSGFPDLKGEYQTDPNQPLFILDGFETTLTKIIDMDMERVVSVTLLKDAAAKAIYGSKAANGVVVIETKQPEPGKMQVTYTGSLNVQVPDLSSYDLCNAAEKLQVEYNAGLYDYLGYNGSIYWNDPNKQYEYTQEYNELLKEVLRGVDTDWLAQPLRTGWGQKHAIYLEGGDEYLRYGVDFSWNNIKGVMKGSDRSTLTGAITLSYRYKNLMFRNNLEVTYNKGKNSPWGNFSDYASMNPYLRIYDENGKLQKTMTTLLETYSNPMWNTTINTKDESEYLQITENFYGEWMVFENFKLTGRIGITRTDSGSEVFLPATHTNFVDYTTDELLKQRGQYTYGDGTTNSLSCDINATYSKSINKHLFFTNVGWSLSTDKSNSMTMVAEGFPNDRLDDITFARSYEEDASPSGSESTTRNIGVLGVLNYSFDERYLFDASIRFSGSSQFGSDNRWGKFWSLGLGWNLHHEHFMASAEWLNQLKLRASWGYTGSQNFNSYQSKATYSYNANTMYDGNSGAYLLGIANEKLKWQRKEDINVGFDFAALDRKLNVRFDYYISNTDDLLTDVTLPSSTGFTSYKENLGKVQNTGYEFRVSYQLWSNSKEQSFVNVYVAATHNENKIKQISSSLAQYNEEAVEEAGTKPITRYEEGASMNAIWTVPSLGIDPATGQDVFVKPDGSTTFEWDDDYLAVCGNTEDKIVGNAGVNIDYKGFSLNIGMNFQWGAQIYNQTLVDKVENADLNYNVDRRIFSDRWVNPGDISRFKNVADQTETRATQRFVEDDNLWTLSSLNFSYDFDRLKAFDRLGFRRLRLSFDMSDVARISSVKLERGTSYPFARSFSFSLQAMF